MLSHSSVYISTTITVVGAIMQSCHKELNMEKIGDFH